MPEAHTSRSIVRDESDIGVHASLEPFGSQTDEFHVGLFDSLNRPIRTLGNADPSGSLDLVNRCDWIGRQVSELRPPLVDGSLERPMAGVLPRLVSQLGVDVGVNQ